MIHKMKSMKIFRKKYMWYNLQKESHDSLKKKKKRKINVMILMKRDILHNLKEKKYMA